MTVDDKVTVSIKTPAQNPEDWHYSSLCILGIGGSHL
jgi:hypothetical protein